MAPNASPKATPPRFSASRLLSLKFMNRSGPTDSSPTASSPSTPLSKSASAGYDDAHRTSDRKRGQQDDDDDERPAKRPRASTAASSPAASANSTPASNRGMTMADMEAAMRASLEDEERRRQAAIKQRAAELGDEQWTWGASLPPHIAAKLAANTAAKAQSRLPYSVVRVGFAEIDRTAAEADHDASDDTTIDSTKPRIMRFNMKASGKDEGSTAASDDEASKLATIGDVRKRPRSKKEPATKLKNLTSVSSQGGQNTMKCHRCGRAGHKASNCPSSNPRRTGSKKR